MGNARKAQEQSSAFRTFLCVGDTPGLSLGWVSYRAQGTGVRISTCLGKQKSGAGTRPERIACVRGKAKKKTGCASCSPQPRGRARHGEEKDEANRFADIRRTKSCIAGDEPADTDSSAPGRRVRVVPAAGAGFLPARENRSPAQARTRNEPRACETRRRNKHGARLARRSRASCSPQVRYIVDFCASADGSEKLGRSGDWVDQQKKKEGRAAFRPVRTWRRGAPPPAGPPAGTAHGRTKSGCRAVCAPHGGPPREY